MNEQQKLLNDMAEGLFASLGPRSATAAAWPQIEELGLPALLVSEDAGGFGGSWEDALIVFRQAGYHALAAPVVEAILAAHVGSALGFQGRGAIATAQGGALSGDTVEETIHGVIGAQDAAFVVIPMNRGGSTVVEFSDATLDAAATMSGEARDTVTVTCRRVVSSDIDIFALGAFARTAQIAGALDAALALSVGYVNERKQFGRPLAKFQAVQQNLATFACEAAAANCAAIAAAQALDRGDGAFEVAAAKLRCNRAAGIGASIAHQVHGAIGFTEEYGLHRLTRRLWSWRSEFGNDSHWAAHLGAGVCQSGADSFWPNLTELTDRLACVG